MIDKGSLWLWHMASSKTFVALTTVYNKQMAVEIKHTAEELSWELSNRRHVLISHILQTVEIKQTEENERKEDKKKEYMI